MAAAIGLSLLLFAVQTHQNWWALNQSASAFAIVNKPVSLLHTMGLESGFSEEEIQDLSGLPSVKRVGPFRANDFRVSLGSSNLGFRTDAFFETVPDDFVDVDYPQWGSYRPGDVIPIVISSDYLALYNFGFAPSQGLPQLTGGTIGMVKMDVTLQGNGRQGRYKGRIVGFSPRLNSIIVPGAFMEYANGKYGSGSPKKPARLMLEVENPKAAHLLDFLKEKGYEMAGASAFGEETAQLVSRGILLVSLLGLLVLSLTLLVLYLNYRLAIEERLQGIRILYTQGYTPEEVARPLAKGLMLLLLAALVIALLLNLLVQYSIARHLNGIGFSIGHFLGGGTWLAWLAAAALLLWGSRSLVGRTLRQKYL